MPKKLVNSKAKKSSTKSTEPKDPEPKTKSGGSAKVVILPVKILGRIIWPQFLRNAWHELGLVTWPGWKLSRQLTVAVIIFAVVFAALVGLLDWGLNKAFKELFLR